MLPGQAWGCVPSAAGPPHPERSPPAPPTQASLTPSLQQCRVLGAGVGGSTTRGVGQGHLAPGVHTLEGKCTRKHPLGWVAGGSWRTPPPTK